MINNVTIVRSEERRSLNRTVWEGEMETVPEAGDLIGIHHGEGVVQTWVVESRSLEILPERQWWILTVEHSL